jgi:hypothetical protein
MQQIDTWLATLPIQSLLLSGDLCLVPSMSGSLRCLSVRLPLNWTCLPRLPDLELLGFEITDEFTPMPPPGWLQRKFPGLRGLRLRALKGCCALEHLPLSTLRELDLDWQSDHWHSDPPAVSLDLFRSSPFLESLKLSACRPTSVAFGHPRLRRLELCHCECAPEVDLRRCQALESFGLKTRACWVASFFLPPSVRSLRLRQTATRLVLGLLQLNSRLDSLLIDDIGSGLATDSQQPQQSVLVRANRVTLRSVHDHDREAAAIWLSNILPCCTDQDTKTLRLCCQPSTFPALLDVVASSGLRLADCTRVALNEEHSLSCSVRSLTKWTRTA